MRLKQPGSLRVEIDFLQNEVVELVKQKEARKPISPTNIFTEIKC